MALREGREQNAVINDKYNKIKQLGVYREVKLPAPSCGVSPQARSAGGMGVSFQAGNHLPGGCGTAPRSNIIMAAAPKRKVASMMDIPCACPGSPEYWRWGR
jgi:hypothetical protein